LISISTDTDNGAMEDILGMRESLYKKIWAQRDSAEKPSKLRLDPPYFDQRNATHLTLKLVTLRVKLSRLVPLIDV
jgi:hypothetical protein